MCLFKFLPHHPPHHLPADQSPKRLLGRPMGDGSGEVINLTLASEVGSKKHRRFPSPSAARQNFLCSLWMFAMHWRTTSSSCQEKRHKCGWPGTVSPCRTRPQVTLATSLSVTVGGMGFWILYKGDIFIYMPIFILTWHNWEPPLR